MRSSGSTRPEGSGQNIPALVPTTLHSTYYILHIILYRNECWVLNEGSLCLCLSLILYHQRSQGRNLKGERENTNIPPEVPDRLTVIMHSSGVGSLCWEHLMIITAVNQWNVRRIVC